MLLLASAAWGQDPAKPAQPVRYDLDRPLCRQMQLSPDLIGALTPPRAAVLGVPAAVQVALPLGGVGAVRIGGVTGGPAGVASVAGLGGLGAVKLDPALPAPTTGGQSAILLARVRAGDQGPELEAALRKVPAADLVAEVKRCPWWSGPDQVVSDRLMTVLIERGDVDLKASASLDYALALAGAERLRRKLDGRCVPVYEELLRRHEGKPAEGWLQEAWGLASYHRSVGQRRSAADCWLSAGRSTTSQSAIADYEVEAANDLAAVGDVSVALDLWQRAGRRALAAGDAWVAGAALVGRARALMSIGELDAAAAALREPLAGAGSEDAAIGLACVAGEVACRRGDLAAAEELLLSAATSYRSRPSASSRANLAWMVRDAAALGAEVRTWRAAGVHSPDGELRWSLAPREISSSATITVRATVDHLIPKAVAGHLAVRESGAPEPVNTHGLRIWLHRLTIEAQLPPDQRSAPVILELRGAPDLPALRLTGSIERRPAIRCTPGLALLDGRQPTATVQLAADAPFAVAEVRSPSPALTVEVTPSAPGKARVAIGFAAGREMRELLDSEIVLCCRIDGAQEDVRIRVAAWPWLGQRPAKGDHK